MLDVHYSMKVSEVFYAKLSSFFILSLYWNAKKFFSLLFYFIPRKEKKKYDMNSKGRSISTMRLHTHYFIQQTHVLFRFFSNDFWILFFSSISCCISMCLHFSKGCYFLFFIIKMRKMTREENCWDIFKIHPLHPTSRHELKAWKL